MRNLIVVLDLLEKLKDFGDEVLWVAILFADGKVEKSNLSIDLKKHVSSDLSDLTGYKFCRVKNRNYGLLDDATKELDVDFIKDYSWGTVDQNGRELVFFGINFEEFILLEY